MNTVIYIWKGLVIIMSNNRIYGEMIDIDTNNVQDFYDKRAEKVNESNPYSAVLLSDHSPELIEEQIKIEKETIFPLLNINNESRVLDIGCGIGRWAEEIIPICDYYYGIDFSQNMVNTAKQRFSHSNKINYKFERMSFQELTSTKQTEKFNRVIISGILVYICDNDIKECIKNLPVLLDDKCVVFIWEPCGVGQRLTLKNFYSDSLNDEYNVIYRTRDEYDKFFNPLADVGFKVTFNEYYSSLGGTVTYTDTDKIYYVWER